VEGRPAALKPQGKKERRARAPLPRVRGQNTRRSIRNRQTNNGAIIYRVDAKLGETQPRIKKNLPKIEGNTGTGFAGPSYPLKFKNMMTARWTISGPGCRDLAISELKKKKGTLKKVDQRKKKGGPTIEPSNH